ncbi:hypothetical protein KVP08_023545 (plasmid) [Shewanella putrefaciens]|nr:hypothetical protein KVP08_023545 [Shewanella putrefaciens]
MMQIIGDCNISKNRCDNFYQRANGIVPMCCVINLKSAATSIIHKLTTHQIDRLMGHAEYGEHLGSDHTFPASIKNKTYFDSLPADTG